MTLNDGRRLQMLFAHLKRMATLLLAVTPRDCLAGRRRAGDRTEPVRQAKRIEIGDHINTIGKADVRLPL